MDGILLVDKPKGWTSFDVVAKVRSVLRPLRAQSHKESEGVTPGLAALPATSSKKVKVGHTGTLDPLATGLLVLLLGKYTKRAPELTKLDKTYEVVMQLGATSTTGDAEGIISPAPRVTYSRRSSKLRHRLTEVMNQFVGEIEQVPPVYSAVKVGGQRAYKLARAGKAVELKARQVTVHNLQLTEYSYPEVKFIAGVSSGTYIRSLVEDIGKALGTGAYMSDLRRTRVGSFDVKNAISVEGLTPEIIQKAVLT